MFKKSITTLGALIFSSSIFASYPENTVTIVVPFPAGQTGDIVARSIGEQLSKRLGQPFVVENRAGAGGRLGTGYAARAKNDGYTLLLTSTGPYAIAPTLYSNTNYEPISDFIGIASIASTPQMLAVNGESGIDSLDTLLTKTKKNEVAYASAGNGSTQHLTMELLKLETAAPMQHIPYKGSSESKTAVLGGVAPVTVDSIPAILSEIQTGKLQALAVIDTKRSPFLPNVKTLEELGYPALSAVAFFGLVAPSGTPNEAINILNENIRDILTEPDMVKRFESLALTTEGGLSPQEFQAYLETETLMWKKVIKESGVVVE